MALTPEQIEIYRNMPPWRKLGIAADFYFAARELKTAALKMQHPDWSDEQVQSEVRKVFLYASN